MVTYHRVFAKSGKSQAMQIQFMSYHNNQPYPILMSMYKHYKEWCNYNQPCVDYSCFQIDITLAIIKANALYIVGHSSFETSFSRIFFALLYNFSDESFLFDFKILVDQLSSIVSWGSKQIFNS